MKINCPYCNAKATLKLSSDIPCTGCGKVFHIETDRERQIRMEVERHG